MAYKLFSDKLTPAAAIYHGSAEMCSTKFVTGPEQTSFVDSWLKNNLVSNAVAEVRNEGGTVLRVTVYRDISPTWTTKWLVEITAYWGISAYAGRDIAMEVGFGPWAIVIAAIFAALVIAFVVKPFIESVTRMLWAMGDIVEPLANPWLWGVILAGAVILFSQSKQRRDTS